ncbi:glycosyltransferase family 4 protein [Stieleria varia]|uniref:Alpha-D-kanosaminyltransferase n=1 Tax=Stieleria varia TaxID=2528005 RepID=A0A5C6AQM8_9BACT|nr:glycosyltransferase family 4 protein [Stieleria varia]TWU01282.1 Alpha-D-kanosaminyltransferase [Stieleria varia]
MSTATLDSASPGATGSELPFVLHTRIVNGVGGGPEKTILNSPRYLRALGYDSACLYLHPSDDPGIHQLSEKAMDAGAEIIAWPDGAPIDFDLVRRLAKLCRERKVSIWHAHDYKTNVLGLQVRRHWPMKLVTTTHGWGVAGFKNQLYSSVGKACLPFYDAVIAVSDDLQRSARRWLVPASRVHLIQNAIDTEAYKRQIPRSDAKSRLGMSPESGLLLVGLGRLSAEKGFDHLIDVVSQVRSQGHRVTLWIGGEGNCREPLEQQIKSLQLQDCVRLLGHVADPKMLLQAADIFVLSSTNEGLPNVVLEAMAMETPVIATRVAGVPKLIRDGQDGLLVDIGNRQQMTDAITQLLLDPLSRDRLANQARQHIVQSYAFDRRMDHVAAVYDRLFQ